MINIFLILICTCTLIYSVFLYTWKNTKYKLYVDKGRQSYVLFNHKRNHKVRLNKTRNSYRESELELVNPNVKIKVHGVSLDKYKNPILCSFSVRSLFQGEPMQISSDRITEKKTTLLLNNDYSKITKWIHSKLKKDLEYYIIDIECNENTVYSENTVYGETRGRGIVSGYY
jgi:hypothetical protein